MNLAITPRTHHTFSICGEWQITNGTSDSRARFVVLLEHFTEQKGKLVVPECDLLLDSEGAMCSLLLDLDVKILLMTPISVGQTRLQCSNRIADCRFSDLFTDLEHPGVFTREERILASLRVSQS